MNHLNTSAFKVLNHKAFIADLKAIFKEMNVSLKLRPRNKNRKQFYPEKNRKWKDRDGNVWTSKSAYQQDLPAKFATHFAVYTSDMKTVKSLIKLYKSKGINVLYTA